MHPPTATSSLFRNDLSLQGLSLCAASFIRQDGGQRRSLQRCSAGFRVQLQLQSLLDFHTPVFSCPYALGRCLIETLTFDPAGKAHHSGLLFPSILTGCHRNLSPYLFHINITIFYTFSSKMSSLVCLNVGTCAYPR